MPCQLLHASNSPSSSSASLQEKGELWFGPSWEEIFCFFSHRFKPSELSGADCGVKVAELKHSPEHRNEQIIYPRIN